MRCHFLTTDSRRRLLLIFAGWGMDSKPFASLGCRDADVAVVYDYSLPGAPEGLSDYEEIMILAWSYGVIAADRFIASRPELPITRRVAVNGTLYPADDRYGIPQSIFKATLEGLSEASVRKFNMRMCGGVSAYRQFAVSAPERSVASLKAELEMIGGMKAAHTHWDCAYISDADLIIPSEAQRRAWQAEGVAIKEIPGSHLPDFQKIISTEYIDKELVGQRFSAATATYEANASVQIDMARRLSRLWLEASPGRAGEVIEIGAGSGVFTREYTGWLDCDSLTLWDLAEISDSLPGRHRVCDAEVAISGLQSGSLDVVASAATLQWFNSPERFLDECGRVLKCGGLLVVSTFGADNFLEIGPSGYPDAMRLRSRLERQFEILAMENRPTTLEFPSPRHLLRHLKLTGVNALQADSAAVGRARSIIRQGICKLTYDPLLIVARRK